MLLQLIVWQYLTNVVVHDRLYETVHTLYPDILDHIAAPAEPFCVTEKNGLSFSDPQFSHGPWKGYLVGVVGDVAAKEEDTLWPNRVHFCESAYLLKLYLMKFGK